LAAALSAVTKSSRKPPVTLDSAAIIASRAASEFVSTTRTIASTTRIRGKSEKRV
jgi:hypothetical protein